MIQNKSIFTNLKKEFPVQNSNRILIKFEYCQEKRALLLNWPLTYNELLNIVSDNFGSNLNLTWIQGIKNRPIKSQFDMENVISSFDTNSKTIISLTPKLPEHLQNENKEILVSSHQRYSAPNVSLHFPLIQVTPPNSNPIEVKEFGGFIPDTTDNDMFHEDFDERGGVFVPVGEDNRNSGGSFSSDSTTNSSDHDLEHLGSSQSHSLTGASGWQSTLTNYSTLSSSNQHQPEICVTAIGDIQRHEQPISQSKLILADNNNNKHNHAIAATGVPLGVPKQWTRGRLLGTGGFGSVYIARDNETHFEMAVKQIAIHESSDKSEIQSFDREIRAMQNLTHPRIILYFGIEKTDSNIFIFMEYMAGGSLYSHIKKIGVINEKLCKKFTKQILEGIQYLHSKTIVHRDIKSANILKNNIGDVKLGDFGASKRIGSILSRGGKNTNLNSVHGTSYWMAPEVIKGEGYGRRADIWSLGCTLVEMITGNPPWYNYDPMPAMFKIAFEKTEPDLPQNFSSDCKDFVKMCLISSKEERLYAHDLMRHTFIT